MKTPFSTQLWICVICVLFLHGCKDEFVDPKDKFKIGALLPLTGSAASVGESAEAAINLAVADINEYLNDIGNDLEIEVVIMDTGTVPDTTLQKLMELDNAGIKYFIGPYASANVEAV